MARRSPQITAAWIAGGCAIAVGLIAAIASFIKPAPPPRDTAPSATASGNGQAIAINDTDGSTIVINAPAKPKRPARLEVTDIVVDCYRKDYNGVLDFRVINRGDKPMSVSRVRLKALAIEEIQTLGLLDYSAKYNLDISDISQVGQIAEVPVSHKLEPGEVDRFVIILTAREMPTGLFRIWQFEPTIVTSEGNVVAKTVDVGLPWDIRKTSIHPYFDEDAAGEPPESP